jgi:RNA polymerase sigma-70 factor (ECF subfamily)
VTERDELEALSDEELIRASTRNDHEPFRVLVRRHKDRIFGLIMRQVGERATAEDLSQEIFIRAFNGLPKFRFDAAFSTWLTRIALNQINTFFTSKRYRESKRSQPFDLGQHDAAQGENEEQINEEQLKRFREGLALLKPIHRDVIVLCGLEGRSYEETAQILNIPIGTVRSRLNHARQQLQTLLTDN